MKLRNQNSRVTKQNRLPFIDKTNLNFPENCNNTLKDQRFTKLPIKQGKLEQLVTSDWELGNLKINVQKNSYNQTTKTSAHTENIKRAQQRFISTDPKFSYNVKVHLLQLDLTSDNLIGTKSRLLKRPSDDSKLNLPLRVCVPRISLTNSSYSRMDNENTNISANNDVKNSESDKHVIKNRLKTSDCLFDLDAENSIHNRKSILLHKTVVTANDKSKPEIRNLRNRTTLEITRKYSSSLRKNQLPNINSSTEQKQSRSADISTPEVYDNLVTTKRDSVNLILEPSKIEIKKTGSKGRPKKSESQKNTHKCHAILSAIVLRNRRTKNYAESSSSLKDTPTAPSNLESTNQHIPIYLKNPSTIPALDEKDPFEFIPETPKAIKKKKEINRFKREKRELSDSDSMLYDKSMHYVLRNIRNKIERTKSKKVENKKTARGKTKIQQPYTTISKSLKQRTNKNVNSIGKKLAKQTVLSINTKKSKTTVSLDIINKALDQEIQDTSKKMLVSFNKKKVSPIIETVDDESDNYFGFEEDMHCELLFPDPPKQKDSDVSKKLRNMRHINQTSGNHNFVSLTSTPLPNKQKNSRNIPNFNNSKTINVISNILITPPKASSVLNNALPKTPESRLDIESENLLGFGVKSRLTHKSKALSPWRSDDLNVRRNPHLLYIKNSALPCYNQEMILKPNLIENSISKVATPDKEMHRNVVQSSILDYVTSNKIDLENSPVKNSDNMTLFDYNDFSPIKNKDANKQSTPTKPENTNVYSKIIRSKKKIFNRSPLKESSYDNIPLSNKFTVKNYFGFDSFTENSSGKENRVGLNSQIKPEAMPMRLDVNRIKALKNVVNSEFLFQSQKNQTNKDDLQIAQENNKLELTFNSQIDNQSELPVMGLFEEFETKPLHRSYEHKRPKRVRFPSTNSDAVIEDEKPKRKRKDTRTKVEEEEFNKWAATFNAMCEEIDKHNLETE